MEERDRRIGQGLVEFALILPILLFLLFAILDFGYIFIAYSSLFNAAREGVRYGMIQPRDKVGIVNRSKEQMFLIDRDAPSISITYDNASAGVFTDTDQVEVGDRISVIITHDLPTLTPLVQRIAPTLHMDTSARRTIASLGDTVSLADFDGDGVPDSVDDCPTDPNKTSPGVCGCGVPDIDSDGDGYFDSPCGDCDDLDPNINPGADEVCSGGVDEDCDGDIDCDDGDCTVDNDGDGYGIEPCDSDCDDTDPAINPGASEVSCNDKDDDCDPSTLDKPDADGDGFTPCSGDCDDSDSSVNPAAAEVCAGGLDDDCDGDVDCVDSDCTGDPACASIETSCDDLIDNDGDGQIDCADTDCLIDGDGDGYDAAPCGSPIDCDDGSSAVHPGALESCNDIDDNCDGRVDEEGASGCGTHWRDSDGDTYGLDGDTRCLCAPEDDYTATRGGDCDDATFAVNPDADESCDDDRDNDCDGDLDCDDADCEGDPTCPLMAIDISEPVNACSAGCTVPGTAANNQQVRIHDLHDAGWGSDGSTTDVSGEVFEFSGLAELVAGHVIQVEGVGTYNSSDAAVVQGDLADIAIASPLCQGDDYVMGTAQAGRTVTLDVIESGYRDSAMVDASGAFTFWLHGSQPLQMGQSVQVSGYGKSAAAGVEACTTDAFLTISPQCGPVGGSMDITVSGHNWSFQNKNDDVTILWDGSQIGTYDTPRSPPSPWQEVIHVQDVQEGVHTVSAGSRQHRAVSAEFLAPCPAPNLIITGLSLITPGPLSTYQALEFQVTVENNGTMPIDTPFWIDLYSGQPSVGTPGIAWTTVGSLNLASVTLNVVFEDGFDSKGTYQIRALADSGGQISEIDEMDNGHGPVDVEVTEDGAPPPAPDTGTGAIEGETWVSLNGLPTPWGRVHVEIYSGDEFIASTVSDTDASYRMGNLPIGGGYTVVPNTWIDGALYEVTLTGIEVGSGTEKVLLVLE